MLKERRSIPDNTRAAAAFPRWPLDNKLRAQRRCFLLPCIGNRRERDSYRVLLYAADVLSITGGCTSMTRARGREDVDLNTGPHLRRAPRAHIRMTASFPSV